MVVKIEDRLVKIVLENPNLHVNHFCNLSGISYNHFRLLFPNGMKELLELIVKKT